MVDIIWKKLDENAFVPKKAYEIAAGYDLFSTEKYTLKAGERYLFKTNIAMDAKCQDDRFFLYHQIESCSGNAYKKGLDYLGGVIDQDYRGNIGVILLNTSKNDIDFNVGDKIGQLIIKALPKISSEKVLEVGENLSETTRGDKGYGSTGVAG